LLRGLFTPLDGFLYLLRRPTLWRYAIVPVVLNLLITSVVFVLFLSVAIGLLVWLHDTVPEGWKWVVAEILSGIGLTIATLGGALAMWKLLERCLCGWFYARLARNIELKLGTRPEELVDLPWTKQLTDTLREVVALLLVNTFFLLLHLIPVIGSVIGTVGGLYFTCWILGRDYLSYPLNLRGRRWTEKLTFAQQNRGPALGLGAAVLLFNFIPLIGPIFLTAAVAGSVLMYHDLNDQPHRAVAPVSGG
jgi:CysZ protein